MKGLALRLLNCVAENGRSRYDERHEGEDGDDHGHGSDPRERAPPLGRAAPHDDKELGDKEDGERQCAYAPDDEDRHAERSQRCNDRQRERGT